MSLQTRLTALATAVGADIKSLNGKVLTAGAITLDTWHVVGAAGEAAFQNGWVNYGSSLASAAYRKDPFGKVKLRGTIKNGTVGGPAFTLPVGYRPPTDLMFPTGTGGPLTTFSFIQIIAATGAIYVGSSANNGAVELDQIEFDTESVTTVLAGPKGDKGDAGAAGAPGGNALVPMDPWHTVGNSGEPAFENGWVNYNTAAYLPLQFRKDPFGKVQMRGMVKNGSMGASVFTLPAAYRPPAGGLVSFMSYTSATTFAAWQVDSSGKVSCYYRNDFCDAAVVEFDTDTVTQAMVGPQGPKGDTGAVGGNATVPMDTWHQVATTGEPAFLNGWSNYSGAFGGARFRKYPDGRVRLAGTIKGGASGSTAFILPVGYRPAGSSAGQPSYLSLGSSGGGSVQVLVDPGTGEVKLYAVNGSVPGTFTYLDGVEFDTETVTQYAVGPAGPQGPVGGNATVPMDPWHTVAAVGEPAYEGGSVSVSGQPIKFRKDPLGRVHVEGAATVGNNGYHNVFTLPVGYRPAVTQSFICPDSAGVGRQMTVYASGGVEIPGSLATTFVWLSDIDFDTESVTQMPTGPQGPKGDTGGNATVSMDTWHQVGNSGEPAFTNGWINDSPAQPAKFRKYPDGKVRIEGRIKVGNFGTAAFTLPVGYRPAQLGIFPVAYGASSAQGSAEVRIGTDGTVSPFSAPLSTSPGNYLALDGLEFDTESVTQFAVGPQGPKGDPGGFTGLVKDLDGINWGNYAPFRSKLGFAGANVSLTDGGPDDGFGGGDFTIVTIGGPTKGSGPLPNVGVREGAEYDLVVTTGLIWRFRYTSGKWVFVGGPPMTFAMKGENNAYFTHGNGNAICVNASSKVLQWQITPLVDVWVDVEFWVGLMQKVDLNYHYIQMTTLCTPTAPIVGADRTATRTQHGSVQQFEPYAVRGLYGLSAGVAYSLYLTAGYTGGTWQYHQATNNVNMIGKAWPR